ncbi:MAG: hypothetical protein AAF199_03265 [Pseudomonadota bacterium]
MSNFLVNSGDQGSDDGALLQSIPTAMAPYAGLWSRLSTLSFDAPAAQFCFADRLARDNNWSPAFAARVVTEYRRFAFLARVTGHEVTPSDAVDQAWHLHLTYTRHYWGPFAQALGAPLHHGPTLGGPSERTRYADNYAKTLASYEQFFGELPSADIWPESAERFAAAPHMRRVDMRQMSKPAARNRSLATLVAGIGGTLTGAATTVFLLAATAQTGGAAQTFEALRANPKALVAIGSLLLLIGLIAASTMRRSSRSGDGATGGYANSGTGKDGSSGDNGGGDSGCGGGCGGNCGG